MPVGVRKKSEEARQTLIAAAASLIAERGNAETITFREIAERAGVASASKITYHFQSKANLLREVTRFVLDNRCPNPVVDYLKRKRELLDTREGQSLFICGLVDHFCDFFQDLSTREWSYSMMYRTLLQSRDVDEVVKINNAAYFNADALAFVEIHRMITGTDDFEQAYCWFYTVFVPLALQLSNHYDGKSLDAEHEFSKQFATRMIFFCRNLLLRGLGLSGAPGEPPGRP